MQVIIAVNTANPYAAQHSVVSNPVYRSLERWAEKHPLDEIHFLFDGPVLKELITRSNFKGTGIRAPGFFRAGYDFRQADLLRKLKPDMILNTGGVCVMRTSIPQILMLPELSFIDHPGLLPKKQVSLVKKAMMRSVKKASVIISPSAYSQQLISANYQLADTPVRVIVPVPDAEYRSIDQRTREDVKEKFAEGREFYLFRGSIEPGNDLFNLLKAFSLFKKRQKTNMLLLIAPAGGIGLNDMREKLMSFKFRQDVKVLESLSLYDRASITGAAYGFVYPALYADHALPQMEAIQCGIPVITCNTGAIGEQCGESALYARPADMNDLAEKMMLLFKNEDARKDLIRNGQDRAKEFNIDVFDDGLREVVMQCMNQ